MAGDAYWFPDYLRRPRRDRRSLARRTSRCAWSGTAWAATWPACMLGEAGAVSHVVALDAFGLADTFPSSRRGGSKMVAGARGRLVQAYADQGPWPTG